MELALKVIVGLFALLFLFLGVGFMFDPGGNAADLALSPLGEHGLNTVRGDLGGLFIGSTLLLALGILQRKSEWLLAVALLMAAIALGRLVGFVLDGNPSQATLAAFGLEMLITIVLVLTSRKFAAAG